MTPFLRLVEIVKALRTPVTGCPWDLEQTHESIKPYLVEETYEVLDAIDSGNDKELTKELGDLLLQVVLHSQIAADRNAFTVDDVAEAIAEKLVRRHPHVFGETSVSGSSEVLRNWEQIKQAERKESDPSTAETPSVLTGIPRALPALIRAQRIGEKASKVNFDWRKRSGVWNDLLSEIEELNAELKDVPDNGAAPSQNSPFGPRIGEELGDVLFSVCQLARWVGVSAEDSLRGASDRFEKRFRVVEKELGETIRTASEAELDAAWKRAKKLVG